jgi:hypothetical protein
MLWVDWIGPTQLMPLAHDVNPSTFTKIAADVLIRLKKLSYAAVDVQRANFQNLGLNKIFWELIFDTGHKIKLLLMTHAKILIYGSNQF